MQLPRAYGLVPGSGTIRLAFEDFNVTEELGFEPPGEGAHWFLWVEKRGATTPWIARRLAGSFGCSLRDIGYSGLKDRHAVTRQWFSAPAGVGAEPPGCVIDSGDFSVLRITRNPRKLKRGTHRANRFRLVIRDLRGESAGLRERLSTISRNGVPNYFGPQRFGHNGNNLAMARSLFDGAKLKRSQRGFALSAARAEIFNRILGSRIEASCWNTFLAGDHANLNGRGSVFPAGELSAEIRARCERGEIHPTGTLWGMEGSLQTDAAAAIENSAATQLAELKAGLEQVDIRSQHRALRLMPADLDFNIDNTVLELNFSLPSGAFATTLLNEVLEVTDASMQDQGS